MLIILQTKPKFQTFEEYLDYDDNKDKTYIEVEEFSEDNQIISPQFPQLKLSISQLFSTSVGPYKYLGKNKYY